MKKNRIKLMLYTPVKIVHMIAKKLYRSQIAEAAFVILGLGLTVMLGLKLLWPFDTGGKVVIAMLYSMFMFSLEIMLLVKIWETIVKFILDVTENGNIKYNTYRDDVRKKSGNYSMGLDEEALVGIDYFIKKNKKEKVLTYIHD